ncbi:MAG: DUF4160 domain-containing protein [Cyclobacteriaceae bacterium]
MPTISMFYGIIVRMFYGPKEHNPPHIHVYYQDSTAVFNLENGELTKGEMPKKQTKLVQAWIEIHREELMADCELCQNGEKPFQIDPLK